MPDASQIAEQTPFWARAGEALVVFLGGAGIAAAKQAYNKRGAGSDDPRIAVLESRLQRAEEDLKDLRETLEEMQDAHAADTADLRVALARLDVVLEYLQKEPHDGSR